MQIIKGSRIGDVHYVPGEGGTATDDGALYLERYGKGTLGTGWYGFDHKGVHFIGLNNSLQVDAMGGWDRCLGMGTIGLSVLRLIRCSSSRLRIGPQERRCSWEGFWLYAKSPMRVSREVGPRNVV
jgi:hypothetical protein